MPYYLFVVTSIDDRHKTAELINRYEKFRDAKTEAKRLRSEQPLPDNQIYKINFSATEAEAEKAVTEYREEPVAKEWEK